MKLFIELGFVKTCDEHVLRMQFTYVGNSYFFQNSDVNLHSIFSRVVASTAACGSSLQDKCPVNVGMSVSFLYNRKKVIEHSYLTNIEK